MVIRNSGNSKGRFIKSYKFHKQIVLYLIPAFVLLRFVV
jgi:hypothetical protein